MKISRLIVIGFLGVVLAFGLAGCIIISASPNPGMIIEMKPGDKKLFKVNGPVNSTATKCVWTVARKKVDYVYDREVLCEGKNEFEYAANSDSELTNRVTINCYYQSYQYVQRCGPLCHWGWEWVTIDSRQWEVRLDPGSSPVVKGDYLIEDSTDMQMLNGYAEVKGSLEIRGDIKNLEGLDQLTRVDGDLYIQRNSALTSLSGLGDVTVGGGLHIEHNDMLTSLSGLKNITFGGDLSIGWNYSLTNLTGLENLASVDGSLFIGCNASLTSLSALGNITSVGGNLRIGKMP